MSKVVEHTHCIYNNPFIFTPLIIAFYKNYRGKEKDVLLSYLILPLVLYEFSRKSLKNANVTSSLRTFKRKNENLYGLPQRVESYKEKTNKCLQYAIDNKLIKIDNNLTVDVLDPKIICEPSLKDAFKAASNIFKVLRDLDVVAIYRLLGVNKL